MKNRFKTEKVIARKNLIINKMQLLNFIDLTINHSVKFQYE